MRLGVMRSVKAVSLALALLIYSSNNPIIQSSAFAEGPSSVYIEELTWAEIQARLQAGTTIAIIPTGATEEEGPHMVTGKHNEVVRYAAGEIARKLGNALVAPVIPYAPSGRITPPEGNMQFAGTMSISPRAYSLVLADAARSLKQHGFHMICFIGDSKASQAMQAQVAEALSQEWASDRVKVVNVSDYFAKNGQDEWNDANAKIPHAFAHAGHADTSEMMSVDASGVRDTLRAAHSDKDYKTTGASGDSSQATATFGRRYMSLKIEAAIKQIQNVSSHAR